MAKRKQIRVRPETHARLMKIKRDEGRASLDDVLRLLMDEEEARRRKEKGET